jgi:hypothetical protein
MKSLIKALQIMSKYMDGDEYYSPTHCEHDVLYVPTVEYDKVSDEDKKELEKLGFIYNSDGGEGFMSYRYGSC